MFEAPTPRKAPWNRDPHCLSPPPKRKVITIVINATPKPGQFPDRRLASNLGLSALHGCSIFDDQN